MERDPSQGGSDVGNDAWRDIGDEPAASIRDTRPDVLAPIDADAPVSGHVPLAASQVSAAEAPEHDWPTARALSGRPSGPSAPRGSRWSRSTATTSRRMRCRAMPNRCIDEGPGRSAGRLHDPGRRLRHRRERRPPAHVGHRAGRAAGRRHPQPLGLVGDGAPWSDEVSGDRRLISSDTGDGLDAVRILLPEVMEHLTRELGGAGRVLIGIPDRHLLTAAEPPPRRRGVRGAVRGVHRSSNRAARTSRSTGGCSSSSTVAWWNSPGSARLDRRPAGDPADAGRAPGRARRRRRHPHPRAAGGAQRADRAAQGRPGGRRFATWPPTRRPGGHPDRRRARVLCRPGPRRA